MAVLFVTSFTPPMYAATGQRLVRTFFETRCEGTLLVCHEGFADVSRFRRRRLRTFDLARSALLRDWLHDNRDIIPRHLGGSAAVRKMPWFNRNASRWFRKIAALDRAAALGYPSVVWLDSDCVIKERITEREVGRWFGRSRVFYHKSPARTTMDSGVIGMKDRTLLDAVITHYQSGAFRADTRWDDGYQFQLALERHPEIAAVDLAVTATGKRPFGHALPHSPVGRFVFHQKGVHALVLPGLR